MEERFQDVARMQQKLINKVLQNKEIDEELATKIVQDIIRDGLGKNTTIVINQGIKCRIEGEFNRGLGTGELHYQLIYVNVDENGTKDYAYPKTSEDEIIKLLIKKHQTKKEESVMVRDVQRVDREKNLIATLRKGSFKERRVAASLEAYSKIQEHSVKTFKKREQIEKSLYRIFLSLIGKEQAEYLKEIDAKLAKVIADFEAKTGWNVYRDGVEMTDNYINQDDPEFATHDTYRISRNENGFYVSETGAFNGYFANIHDIEIHFFARNKKTLELIHELFSAKEMIMFGSFEPKDATIDRDYLLSIAEYLGYVKKEEKTKKLS